MDKNQRIPVYWPSNMKNEYESEWKYDSNQSNGDSPFIFLIVRVVRLARTARVVWSVMVWSIPVA